jgi:hypothetical protein
MGERFRIRSQAAVTPHTMHFFLHKICLRFPRHGRDHLLDSCLQRYQLHPFFRITDCNPSLSRLRPATRFRSRVFSSRNGLQSCAWLTSMPAILRFPSLDGVLRHAHLACHILHRSPCFHLFQCSHHLRFRVPAPRHTLFPFLSQKSYSVVCRFRGAGQHHHDQQASQDRDPAQHARQLLCFR